MSGQTGPRKTKADALQAKNQCRDELKKVFSMCIAAKIREYLEMSGYSETPFVNGYESLFLIYFIIGLSWLTSTVLAQSAIRALGTG